MLKANYHTHTTFCDGRDTAQDMVLAAIEKGFYHLGFSGHMDFDNHMDFDEYEKEIRRLREIYRDKIDIIMGVELDVLYDPSWADRAEYVIGSTHFLDTGDEKLSAVDYSEEILQKTCREHFGGDYYRLAKAYYELEAGVYDRLHCDMVGHFDLVTRFNDSLHFVDENDRRYRLPALEAMEYLVSEGVPFEINCGAVNRGRKKELYPNRFLLKNLKDFGGEIFINSDAHQKELIDGAFDVAVKTAIECGFTHVSLFAHEADDRLVKRQIALDRL